MEAKKRSLIVHANFRPIVTKTGERYLSSCAKKSEAFGESRDRRGDAFCDSISNRDLGERCPKWKKRIIARLW